MKTRKNILLFLICFLCIQSTGKLRAAAPSLPDSNISGIEGDNLYFTEYVLETEVYKPVTYSITICKQGVGAVAQLLQEISSERELVGIKLNNWQGLFLGGKRTVFKLNSRKNSVFSETGYAISKAAFKQYQSQSMKWTIASFCGLLFAVYESFPLLKAYFDGQGIDYAQFAVQASFCAVGSCAALGALFAKNRFRIPKGKVVRKSQHEDPVLMISHAAILKKYQIGSPIVMSQ